MKDIVFSSFTKKLIVFYSAIFMVVNTNFVGNFSFLDLSLLFTTIFYTLTTKTLTIKKRTFKVIVVLNVFLLLALVPILWTKNKPQSFLYFTQVLFAFNMIPLFIDRLIQINAYEAFLKRVHQTIYFVGILFIINGILHFKFDKSEWLFFTLRGNHRMVWGDGFVGNDLTQFLILGFLLNEYFIKNKKKRAILSVFLLFVFLFTLSRTVLLVGLVYFLFRYTKQTLIFGVLVMSMSVIIVSTNISVQLGKSDSRVGRLFELKNSSSEKGGRLSSYAHVIENTTHFILEPLYGQTDNLSDELDNDYSHKISSVHNVILSVLVNFGFFPFIFLYLTISVVLMKIISKRKFYNFNTFIVFLTLIFLVISLNAFMLSRALWMPVFIILSFLDKEQRFKSKIINA